jgi:hypothetical protein
MCAGASRLARSSEGASERELLGSMSALSGRLEVSCCWAAGKDISAVLFLGRKLLLSWCRVAFASTTDPVSCVCACVSPVAPLSLCGMSHSFCLISSTALVNRPKSAVASVAWSLWASGRMGRVCGCGCPPPPPPRLLRPWWWPSDIRCR